ncbi:MAG: hypothetical protein ABW196_07015 [Solirubrobacterales bacterium]
MALSDDQRALLRLLAKREDGYEDIAALKGLSVEQVRTEVKDALAELDATGEAPAPAPAAKPPELGPRAQASKPAPTSRSRSRPRPSVPAVPAERRRLLVLAGGALGVVAVVLIAIALIGGDSDSGGESTTVSNSEPTAAESDKVTQAVLSAADGSDASGRAVFGRIGKEEIVLQLTAENLEPTDEGESYTVWLYRSPKLSLRVGSAPVSDEGRLGAQFPIPAELLAYIAGGAFDQIYVSRLDNAAYKQEVARAKANKSLPRYSGETILTGEITGPIAKAAAQAEGG